MPLYNPFLLSGGGTCECNKIYSYDYVTYDERDFADVIRGPSQLILS